MELQETILNITKYDEILDVQDKRLLVTGHEEIFSLNEAKKNKPAVLKEAKSKKSNYEDDSFFDYIKEVAQPNGFDFKKFFNYKKQKRIRSKRAKENLHSKEDFPLVSQFKDNVKPHRQKLPYCQSEIFPNTSSSHSQFHRRWHNSSLPRYNIYRLDGHSVTSLHFDQIASALTMEGGDRLGSASDYDLMWKLNELLNQQGNYGRFCLKSHIRQHKEDNDILELFRLYTSGIKKAPQVYYDPKAKIKPSLKHVPSLEVLESEKNLLESQPQISLTSGLTPLQYKKKIRDHVKFEQKKSILPEFRYTGEEQFRVIVYDDEVPYLDFELDQDIRKGPIPTTEVKESILRLRPNVRDISLSDVPSDISLIGLGDYKLKPEDIGKPVMLKFKNMPELLGWFRKINERELTLLDSSDISTLVSEGQVPKLKDQSELPKKDFREIVVQTPLVGLKRFAPLADETGIVFKKLNVTTHDTILSIVPRSSKKDEYISDSDPKEEEFLSIENVVDKLKSSSSLKMKAGVKNVTYKTKSPQKDSLQRLKSSIVNEVVKKVASYFSKDLKPKLEATIKHGQCKCCHNVSITEPTDSQKSTSKRLCFCEPSRMSKASKGVSVDLNDLPTIDCPPSRGRNNYKIFNSSTVAYFKNSGVNANTVQDHGSSDESASITTFDCQRMMEIYENLTKTAEQQMDILKEYQNLLKYQSSKKHVRFAKTALERNISEEGKRILNRMVKSYKAEDSDYSNTAANLSSHIFEVDKEVNLELSKVVSKLNCSKNVRDFAMLDSSSSNDSIQSNFSKAIDVFNCENVRTFKVSKSEEKVTKVTSHKNKIVEDTYNITDISDFECYINYICTHSEKFVQISSDLISKNLKRQINLTNLIKFERNLYCNSKHVLSHDKCDNIKSDTNNNRENYSNDLIILFKRDGKKKKSKEFRNKTS